MPVREEKEYLIGKAGVSLSDLGCCKVNKNSLTLFLIIEVMHNVLRQQDNVVKVDF